MNSAKSMTGLVGNDLPLLGTAGTNHDISTGYSLCRTAAAGLVATGRGCVGINSIVYTGLSEPSKTNGSSGVASREEGPVAVAVSLLATPGREQVKTILNLHTIAATLVPSGVLGRRAGALSVRDGQVGQAE